MLAYSIDPQIKELKELNLEIEANTVYTFLNSISTNEILILDKHTIYSDFDALSKNMKPFFIGEQLIIGKVLILGKEGFLDVESTIPLDDLKSLVNFEVSPFYLKALELLGKSDINFYKMFDVKDKKLDSSWVLYVFSIADENTQNYFLKELEKSIENKEEISAYMKTMAGLAIKAMG